MNRDHQFWTSYAEVPEVRSQCECDVKRGGPSWNPTKINEKGEHQLFGVEFTPTGRLFIRTRCSVSIGKHVLEAGQSSRGLTVFERRPAGRCEIPKKASEVRELHKNNNRSHAHSLYVLFSTYVCWAEYFSQLYVSFL